MHMVPRRCDAVRMVRWCARWTRAHWPSCTVSATGCCATWGSGRFARAVSWAKGRRRVPCTGTAPPLFRTESARSGGLRRAARRPPLRPRHRWQQRRQLRRHTQRPGSFGLATSGRVLARFCLRQKFTPGRRHCALPPPVIRVSSWDMESQCLKASHASHTSD